MARKENGEFEILLGNKQLLSIFFIVVILLGVFFTMGYILGRNSAADSAAAMTAAPRPAGESRPPKEPSAFAGSGVAQPKASEPPAPPSPAEPEPAADLEPAPGQTFLQVVAVQRTEADVVAGVLKQKGFRSLIAAHPTQPIFRVLVGPLPDADAVTRTRTELEDAGFKPIVRKY